MSNQSGIWHYDAKPVSDETQGHFLRHGYSQGPDRHGEYEEPGLSMTYDTLCITSEDFNDEQPRRSADGSVLTWDGRLDNRVEVLAALGQTCEEVHTDSEIVGLALSH
jgi:hypothetical protein